MGSGGAEHQMSILTTMLAERGYNIELVTFSGEGYHYSVSEKVSRIRIAKTDNRILKFLSIFWFFLTHKTDCVISFGQRENMLALIPLVLRPKIKVIAGERNFTVGKQSNVERILFRYLYKRADFIVPNSYSQGEYISAQQPRLSRKIVTITNYTDIKEYHYLKPIEKEIVKIGVFCRYSQQKNYVRFAQVVKMLKDDGYTFQIDWYGNMCDSKGRYNADYIAFALLVEKYNIGSVLKLNDHIKNVKDVIPLYDALCVPSLHEGWSNSISEGICCGRPMLVGDVSDNKRMVHCNKNGFLFNPTDIQSMYNAFTAFLNLCYSERVKMGECSRKYALQLFCEENFVKSYIKLIEDVA